MSEGNAPKVNEAMDFTNPLHENFLRYVWLDTEGTVVKLDEYRREPRASFHIKFSGHKSSLTIRKTNTDIGK